MAEIQGAATVTIAAGSTGQFAVTGLADGTVDITIQNNNSSSNRKGTIHLTVGEGGSAPVDPPVGDKTVDITPSTDNPEESITIAVGETLVINVANGSSSNGYDYTATLSVSGVAEIQGAATVTIAAGSTGQFAVTGLADGTVDITIQNNSSYGSQYVRKGVIHLTVGGGSTPIDPPSGTGVNIGITSDVHGSVSNLRTWIQAVQNAVDPDLDSMLFCGDYSYQMSNLDSFVAEYLQVVSATNELVGEGKGVYTSGNHEYYIGSREIPLNEQFTSVPGFVRIGEALNKANYIVYCMGAAGWYSGIGTYPDEDIAQLSAYLETAPTDIPIFIPAHFPLHMNSNRTITNADKMIELLNEHPNVVFLWGHNHSQSDSHYGQILTAGDSITYANGQSAEINFTYACAGGMYNESQTQYSGLVANISASGDTVTFQYYRTSTGAPIGNSKTVRIEGSGTPAVKYTITATAGENGSISPAGAVSVREGRSQTFTFKADAGYEIDTVLIDGAPAAVTNGQYTFENVTADHTISVSYKVLDLGGVAFKLADTLTAGKDYLIVSVSSGSGYVLTNPGGTSGGASLGSAAVTILTGDIDGDGEDDLYLPADNTAAIWTAEPSNSGVIFTNGGDILEGKSNSIKIFTSRQYSDRYWAYEGQQLKYVGSSSTYTLYYSNGFTGSTSSSSNKIYLFEKTEVFTGTAPVSGVTLDQSVLSLVKGKSVTLKAAVAPSDAANKKVTWSSSDPTVATVTDKGVVKALKEGSVIITVTTVDGGFTASCALTVEPKPAGQNVNIGITSDVHGNLSALRNWLQAVQAAVEPDLEKMLYCGDYSYETSSLSSYVSDFRSVVSATEEIVGEGAGVYTSGNHEYYINGEIPLNAQFTDTPGFTRIGEAVSESNYVVYCLGASGWYNANGQYPDADVAALRTYLQTAPTDIPIFIVAHFPLHYFSSRTVTGAENVIDVLNEHPNVIFLWGHNHSQTDSHYGQILTAGDSIEYASGKSKTISFTYACAGGMYDESQTQYSGLVASISGSGDTVTFQYYRTSTGAAIGSSKTIHIQSAAPVTTYTITASAGANGSITPSGQITVEAGQSAEFRFAAADGYEMDTVLIDGTAVTVSGTSYTFTNVAADHSIQVSFKAIQVETWNDPEYTWSANNLSVTAVRVSSFGNRETETAGAVAATTDPTCETPGETVYTAEFSNPAFETQTRTVEIPALGHDWGAAEYTWSEDNGSVTATRVCTRNADHKETETISSVMNVTTPAGCTADGTATYTAQFTNPAFAAQTKTVEIPALGHEWGEAEYTWSENNSTVTATRVCTHDTGHIETETVSAVVTTMDPTCEEPGKTVYTATFENPAFAVQTKEVTIPALGHIWGEVEYVWSEDNSTVTATRVCTRTEGEIHVETETAETEMTVVIAPTCETDGQAVYAASFTTSGFALQMKQTKIPALGHDWGEAEYVWDDENSTVTATRVCKRDASHTETETAEIVEVVIILPACVTVGQAACTAEFTNPAFTAQTQTRDIPALGHTWGEAEYVWSEDYSSVTATHVCTQTEGETHVETETRQTTKRSISQPTCEKAGQAMYIVTFADPGFEMQTELVEIPALGHDWGEAEYVWAEDNSSVTATRVCTRDSSHTETETAAVSVNITREATCTAEGEAVYTAVFENEAFEAQTKTEALPKLPHSYGKPIWAWDGYDAAFVILSCGKCGDRQTIQAVITAISVEATCTEDGETIYTASAEVNGKTYTDQKTKTIPATGHAWGAVSYVWSADNGSVTATRACANDPSHVETETVQTTRSVKTPATCAAAGEAEYTAVFENAAFEKQTKTEEIPATGHTPGDPVREKEIPATTEAEGSYDEVVYCACCGEELSREHHTIEKLTVPVVISSIKADMTAAATGETITWTATASGGTGPLQYYFILYKDGTKLKTRSYSSANTYSYTPAEPGIYKVRVYVKDPAETKVNKLSADVTVTQAVPPVILLQPSDQAVAAGKTAAFTVTAEGEGLSYQWQYSKNNGDNWYNKSGATSASYTVTAKASYDGFLYRCRVTNSAGAEAISDPAKLIIIPKPVIMTQPVDQTVTAGEKAIFTAAASGEGLSYQWQYSNDEGQSWHNKSGATSAGYSVTAKTSYDGMLYRCKVTNEGGSVYTAEAKLTVTAAVKPEITAQPTAQTAAAGETVTFTVTASGTGLTYQWQYSTDYGKTWTDKAGSTKATHTVTVKASYNGYLYRCVVTNSKGTVTSSKVRLTVSGVKPKILSQPAAASAAVGESVTFNVAAAGEGMTYQWQYSTDGGKTWKKKTGATSASYTVIAKESYNGIQYRCKVTNSIGTVTSTSATLTVS